MYYLKTNFLVEKNITWLREIQKKEMNSPCLHLQFSVV